MARDKATTRKRCGQNRTAVMAGAASNNNDALSGDATGSLPYVRWDSELQEKMLTEVEKAENRIVLCGKRADEKSVGTTKKAVFQNIAREVIPAVYAVNVTKAGEKVQTQWKAMKGKHEELNAQLKQTGGGIGGDDELDADALRQVELDQYIPGDGPNAQNTEQAKNNWGEYLNVFFIIIYLHFLSSDKIVRDYPIFPRLHALFHHRPNQVPIATTTGIGPNGPRMVLHQQPSREPSLERSPSLEPLPPCVRMPSPKWDADIGPSAARKPSNMLLPDFPSDSDSDVEILVPSPPAKGNGKHVDPRERKAPVPKMANKNKSAVNVKTEDPKAKTKAKGERVVDVKEVKAKEAKGEVKVKDEKRTPPQVSKKLADSQAGAAVSGGLAGNRKRKSMEENVLFSIQQGIQERHTRLDTQRELDRLDASYQREMDQLLQMRRDNPNMTDHEFNMREDSIWAEYGKPPLDRRPPSHAPPPPAQAPAQHISAPTQPVVCRTNLQPFHATTSTNVPETPRCAPAATAPDGVLDLTGSSPVYAPRAKVFPFGTPVKQEPLDLEDEENLLAIPNFAQNHMDNNDAPLFMHPPFGFAPSFT